jgi:dolichol kinase
MLRLSLYIPILVILVISFAFILVSMQAKFIGGLKAHLRTVLMQLFALEMMRQRSKLHSTDQFTGCHCIIMVANNKLPCSDALMSQ